MKFTIGKYKKRMNKKDPVEMEQAKIDDYEDRWADYEVNQLIKLQPKPIRS